jgi:hypothetical protein
MLSIFASGSGYKQEVGQMTNTWGLALSRENIDICLKEAWQALEKLEFPKLKGIPPRRVLIVASANVFTATLPWVAFLQHYNVEVHVKAARTLAPALEALLKPFPGVVLQDWRREDEASFKEALSQVSAVLVFGTEEAIAAFQKTGVPTLGFGPRFGSAWLEGEESIRIAEDLSRYDSRGCMSPAACFIQQAQLVELLPRLVEAMEQAQKKWPRGEISTEEARALRTRALLARAAGQLREGHGWQIAVLPPNLFHPEALPRSLVLHPVVSLQEALCQLERDHHWLGSFALEQGEAEVEGWLQQHPVAGLDPLKRVRLCRPGAMQRPEISRWHDGVDVLGWLWSLKK